ncbi:Golgi apparatus membrane protein TVP15 [Nannochloropsis gaditana]|uniref:Golgi apparatus membrane protein TVP15 n=1 Tax=Nannochloropsis gaditana TaxID=72520 RepID=W7TT71_9STRA|nr:Golgi apparatus membrane protein TVP15 [Nannochloropsis gaditana]
MSGSGEVNPFATQSGGDGGPGAGRNRPPSPPRADEPAWLNANAASPPSPAAPHSSHVPIQPATLQPQAATQPQPPSGQTPPLVIYMRVANFALCILMSAAAVLTVIVPAGATPASWVLAFYVLAFSCLLCCFEVNLRRVAKHIANNFGFLYDAKSRATFLIFVGVLCFSLGITGKVAGAAMIANALFNTVVLCKYPQYATNAPTTTAEQEAAQFMQRNPGLARKGARGPHRRSSLSRCKSVKEPEKKRHTATDVSRSGTVQFSFALLNQVL